jgi:hypothetical protein
VARGSMAIGGAVSIAAVRHMHSTVERETDQLKNADANGKIGVSAADRTGAASHGPAMTAMTTMRATLGHLRPLHRLSSPAATDSAAAGVAIDIPPWSLETPDGGIADEVVGPEYPPSPETAGIGAASTSTIVELTMDSRDSAIYPGVDRKPG